MSQTLRVTVLAILLTTGTVDASTAPPGAVACSGCHRPAGAGGAMPAIHGRPADEIVGLMQAYRRGEGDATVMNRIATGFSDAEVEAIAAWLEQQQ